MTTTRTVRATGPADLLALVPSVLGFHPEDSLVVLTIGDARQPFHARVDLPTDAEEVHQLAAHLGGVAERGAVGRVAVVVYSDDGCLTRAVVDALDHELLRVGTELVCAVRADGERWWVLDVVGEEGGTPYDVSSHPLMAQAVLDGTVVLSSRGELAETLVGKDPQETEEVTALADGALDLIAAQASAPLGPAAARHQLAVEARWVGERVQRFLEDGERLDASDVARLLVAMAVSPEVRDAAWAGMARENAARHVDLWRDVVRRTPLDLRAAPAALLGFSAWLCGHGALAWCAVESAHEADPGYGPAQVLERILAAGMPPSSWAPFSREDVSLPED